LETTVSEQLQRSEPMLGPQGRRIRRVVTGHDVRGRSIILSNDASPHVMTFMNLPNFAVTDLWRNGSMPADNGIGTTSDPCGLPIDVAPPAAGSVFRVTQFPPEKEWRPAATESRNPPQSGAFHNEHHPHMHRTQTLDNPIVLSGEIWAVMDEGETKLCAGDTVVQRGTRHAWANRSDAPCVMAFVTIDALPLA
jgi:Cupin domain